MKKKALCIASVASNLDNFNRDNVKILLELGYEITLASNFSTEEDVNSPEKIKDFINEMEGAGVEIVQIDFTRRIFKVGQHIKSMKQVGNLLNQRFDLIHCHSPICAAITRFVARQHRNEEGTKVIYTAHGFHFFKGAPLKNWLIFYPIEKALSRYTDVLITINKEDYTRAKKKFKAKKTVLIHGIGINLQKFNTSFNQVPDKRISLGIGQSEIMLLSVGELSVRKNQGLVIRSLSALNNANIHYYIAGIGSMETTYKELATELGIQNQVHFLGYRTDISELCQSCDVYVFPSLQEGLPVALMEAIACKKPVICSKIRGNVDLISECSYMFDPRKVKSLTDCLQRILGNKDRDTIKMDFVDEVKNNYENLLKYDIVNVNKEMKIIYQNI